MDIAGLFINLDRSPERRAAMEAQLRSYDLADRYRRFPAIDGADGQRACFQSHIGALESAAARHAVHVLEDDALLSGYLPQVVEFAVSTGVLDRFDIVFTETLIGPDVLELRELKTLFDRHRADETFEVRDITSTYQCGMTSYLVGAANRMRVLSALQAGLGSGLPCDLLMRREARAGRLRLGCVFPFVTSFHLEFESTRKGQEDKARASTRAFDLLRYSFFVDCNHALAEKTAATLRPVSTDPHQKLIADVLSFVASDRFVVF
jgi:GR25 family glycosyltransferase involved in LPS biosynthesis